MNQDHFNTPILFILFNRPDTTQKVFDQIKKIKPKTLFIAADGPRPECQTDTKLCAQAREIIKQINWPCELKTLLQDKNLGCGIAPSQAITWFFDHVDQGIILEDDCLPNQSFFYFCQSMLDYYKHDTRIFHIGGTSSQNLIKSDIASDYYFTRIPRIWGWATWARAWKKYDFLLQSFPNFKKNNIIKNIFTEETLQESWLWTFQEFYHYAHDLSKITIWDFQWTYTILSQNGLSITPCKNLISNIGFRPDATHTKQEDLTSGNRPTEEIDTENIVHPLFITPDKKDELWVMNNIFQIKTTPSIIWQTKKVLTKKFPRLKKLYTLGKKKLLRQKI
ncbi:nucleotide-diphospho-sugar transferase [Candidatus Dependentiae bacterium]|nr:nucleotide-diphospho-sugar transferase [Candidatus Dependentiae bacterium]